MNFTINVIKMGLLSPLGNSENSGREVQLFVPSPQVKINAIPYFLILSMNHSAIMITLTIHIDKGKLLFTTTPLSKPQYQTDL